jgi:DNA polymerase II large subunit
MIKIKILENGKKEMKMAFAPETEKYFNELGMEIEKNYVKAREARARGLDPKDEVEVPLAMTMAAKVVRLIATVYPQLDNEQIINRVLELEKQYGALDNSVSLKIAEEIAMQKYCTFKDQLEAMDAGIRVGFAYTTLGVVSSPIEGYTGLKVGKTLDGKSYLKVYFSGPIRSAGTTAGGVGIILMDYIRQLFGYARYDPTEQEAKRTVTELYDYHERITNLQYLPTEEECYFIGKNLPIQVTGEPTEKREVSNFKNLPRIETDFIRGGFCLILGEGIAQKGAKILRILDGLKKNGFVINDWEWLADYVHLHEKREKGKTDASPTYIKDLVAGRPVFGHPGKGFRFRYGRSRLAGFSAASVNPATMAVTNDFIATGTQLKIEKPTKGCCVSPCDLIDGPIVKFKSGSVKKLSDYNETKLLYKEIEEIIYLGDILFPLGDVMNRNAVLIKPGYVEEWWQLEVEKNRYKVEDCYHVSLDSAVKISEEFEVPLHPSYIFYWTQINYEQFLGFVDWINHSLVSNGKLLFPYNLSEKERFQVGKRALELLGIDHDVHIENVILNEISTNALLLNLGFDINYKGELDLNMKLKNILEGESEQQNGERVLEIINKLSKYKIKDKAGEFIGSRMGRPEKAKLRKLTGSPNVLFPVGDEGGRLRSVNVAVGIGSVKGDFPFNYCKKCNRETIYRVCECCGEKTFAKYYCRICRRELEGESCSLHDKGRKFKENRIDVKHYYENALGKIGLMRVEAPELIKGIRGTSSENHDLEHLEKGILRARHNLCVNKDGTIRYDMTELPVSHFKSKEIEVSIEKLRELGYIKDCYGNELINEEQILELKPHDIIIPCNNLCGDEKADDVFINVAKFLDELLVKFYGLAPFYNIKKREDLVGQIGVCMAPHNCAGVICRIIGFSKVQGLLASPYMHAAMRRDCFDYDTYISVKQKGNWRIVKIGDLVESLNPQDIVDNCGTKEKRVSGFETLGFDNGLKEVSVNNFTKHTKTSMLEIKTALGKKIKITENHKFFINGKIKRASDLKIGDKLPLSKRIKIESKNLEEINLLEYLQSEDLMIRCVKKVINRLKVNEKEYLLKKLNISKKQFQNFNLRDSYPIEFILSLNENLKKEIFKSGKIAAKRDNVEVPIIINLSDKLLEVIGLYIAEGYSRSIGGKKGLNQVYIASLDKNLRDFIKKTIFKNFGLKPTENKKDRVTFSSKVLYLFFTKILECGSISQEKRIPSLFLDLKLDRLACVLRGYFEGDGGAEKGRKKVSCDTVSEGLLSDLEFCLARFEIFAKRYEYEKEPGQIVKDFYIKKNSLIPKFKITKLIIGSDFVDNFMKIGFLSKRKNSILNLYKKIKPYGMKINYDKNYIYDTIVSIENIGEKESYCLNVETESHLVVANSIVTKNCDGDEAALMLLLDVLVNFSRAFLPSHRGGTQDAPLVLNGKIYAKEVDDQILDFELVNNYPLEMYEKAEQRLHSKEIKIEMVKQRIGRGEDPYVNTGFTHDTLNFNMGATCSSYKTLPTMQDKVRAQMELCVKLRSVDQGDVARLIIDRHFMKDLKGNLRKFSQQNFRCGKCNEIYRRPPLNGKCEKCGNPKLIFTISYGSIVKYLEPALDLINNFSVPPYIIQDLELTKKYIESIFGKDTEKQESMEKWF